MTAGQCLDIALVIEYIGPGEGQGRVAFELARRWALRHRVTVYCYDAAQELFAAVNVHRLRPRVRHNVARGALVPFHSAAALLGKRHDIILANGGNCLLANFALFHTCHPLRLQTWDLVAAERGSPLTPRERANMLVRKNLFVRLEGRTLRRCRGRAYAVSPRLRQDLAHHHNVPESDILVASNGVDTGHFNPAVKRFRQEVRSETGIPESALVALFIGGIWWEKGLHIALQAVAQARSFWHLLILGHDDDMPAFVKLAQDLGIGGRVHFLGRTDRPERFYGAADCLVLPSAFEGSPLVALEAAACGLPVLISRQGHPGELIDERTGYVLDRQPKAFASALDELAASESARRAMGEAAASAAREFTWDRQAKILERGFLEFAAQASAKRTALV